jgi:hypothetical protein
MPLPTDGSSTIEGAGSEGDNVCGARAGAWFFNSNGTISSAQPGMTPTTGQGFPICLTNGNGQGGDTHLSAVPCSPSAAHQQVWQTKANPDGSVTISQNGRCVDNNYRVPTDEQYAPAMLFDAHY